MATKAKSKKANTTKLKLSTTQLNAAVNAAESIRDNVIAAGVTRIVDWANIPAKIGIDSAARFWSAESLKALTEKAKAAGFSGGEVSRMKTCMSYPECALAAESLIVEPPARMKVHVQRDAAMFKALTAMKRKVASAETIEEACTLTPAELRACWTPAGEGVKGKSLTKSTLREHPTQTNIKAHLMDVFDGCPGASDFATACAKIAKEVGLKAKPAESPKTKAKSKAEQVKQVSAAASAADEMIAKLKAGQLKGAAKTKATQLAALLKIKI